MLFGDPTSAGIGGVDDAPAAPPRWIGEHSELVLDARDDPEQLMRLFRRSPVPMLLLDDTRRYVEANPPARSVLALSVEELRKLRVDDLTPPYLRPRLEHNWERLLEAGSFVSHRCQRHEGNYLGVTYYAVANVLPGRHVMAFVPPGWQAPSEDGDAQPGPELRGLLTQRERQVLALAADGLNGPRIARELVLSTATVRTHFGHIYRKLDVPDRAAAIAKAMRLGLIR